MSKKSRHAAFQLRGTLLAYNLSPKGHIEGAMVATATGLAQLNFPKHAAERMARTLPVGALVDLAARLEHDDGAHPVYAPRDHDEGSVRGTIVRLNYALHGEVNGCHLDDGTFVHLKPNKAKRFALRLGATIAADGTRRPGSDVNVVDATSVTESPKR